MVRAAQLDEALAVIDGLLRGPVDHRGAHFQVRTELLPRAVQQPRPPVWVAAVAPHRRPLARARRWDGVVPLGPAGVLTPQELSDYLGPADRAAGWEVVVARPAGVGSDEYQDAGATWLVEGTDPDGDWLADLRATIRRGPPS